MEPLFLYFMLMCVFACMQVHVCECVCLYVCKYMHMCVSVFVCLLVHVHVCVFVLCVVKELACCVGICKGQRLTSRCLFNHFSNLRLIPEACSFS